MKIVIIGASSGIGKELSLLYANGNNTVVITGRRASLLQEIQSIYPANIMTACFDVTDDNITVHLDKIIEQLGGLDLFIYNAGFGEPSTHYDAAIEIATTKTNVLGFVACVSYAVDFFSKQGVGHIALTSSVAAHRGNSWTPAYSASKAYMSNYAEGLSIKTKKLKLPIAITDIKPGFVRTNMAKGHGQFWVASAQKAARQIKLAIHKKKRVVYITKRWWLAAQVMKRLPFWLYRRIA